MKPMTVLAFDWAIRAFGYEHVKNPAVRSLRCAEEAVELAQALGVTKDTMLKLVEMVYSRPPGEPTQELGGVMMTATVLAAVWGTDPEDFFLKELRRVLAKPVEHFAQRNQDKIALGLDAEKRSA